MGNLGEPAISGDIVQLFVDAAFSKPVATATVTAGATSWSSSTFQTNRPEFQIWAMTVHPPSVDPSYQKGTASEPVLIDVRTKGPKPQDAEPVDLSMTGGKIRVRFDEAIDSASLTKNSFELRTSDTPPTKVQAASASVDGNDPTLVNVDFSNVAPNQYLLYILPPIKDQFGNLMAGTVDQPAYKFPIVQPVGGNAPTLAPGITATAGPFIKFPEYTPPRPEQNGFNPSDKVVTRTARLYYFRDAHRVAQIVNRKARSYNRAAVDVAQQLADRSRGIADQETDARQALERGAVNAATETRAVQHQLDAAQSALGAAQQGQANSQANLSAAQQQTLNAQANGSLQPGDQTLTSAQLRQEVATLQPSAATGSSTTSTGSTTTSTGAPTLTTAQQSQATAETGLANALDAQTAAQTATQSAATQLANAQSTVQDLLQTLQIKRSAEIQANERALQADAAEERAREDQFRREVAAGHADPDTYAPGVPGSVDPVEQVSISVIGEGVIQLRGPIKGVNMVRTMINDIDAPVGQVRVSIDTCQVNGEHGERMEVVVGMIQRYIDHARFLTTQSAEMLRKSVVKVASDKAFMAARECPERSQQFRDEKYLDAFFGQDFIDELRTLDSEFLKTGNKLLSLHSMDTTSLSAALFLFALAKNTTRREILEEFLRQVETELPGDEAEFLQAAGRREPHERRMQLLGENARFVSLRGFFNGEVTGPDTLNPIQRQFIRLAQIFKSRLVTELELNQRVMERSMIEERLGDYIAELRKAKDKDDKAQQA
ncbi:MAG TPA: hypothetical protein VMR25_20700, partial [Planctomycetaceae bacterium]|nr:hypothetical protein [Planctomycetaceae bacterium]